MEIFPLINNVRNTENQMRKNKIPAITPLIIFFSAFILFGCEKIDYGWHKYTNDYAEVFGKQRDNAIITNHGWKIIEGTKKENGNYEWGWEVTIKIKEPKEKEQYSLGITKIEYTLFDKDNFKIISSTLDLNNYNQVVWDNGEKGPVLQGAGITETYRQTAELPKSLLERAAIGRCQVSI